MEHRRVTSELWSQHNVPLDVWFGILSWLPVKSLVRFRCVSKSWQLLIQDPDFCYLHRNRSKNNTDETHLLFVHASRYGFILCSETFETIGKLCSSDTSEWKRKPGKLSDTDLHNVWWSISCIFDGLILLANSRGAGLSLWNPSIRKGRSLPPLVYPFTQLQKTINLGLGLEPLTRDYKVVLICLSYSAPRPVAIYSVGTNSWKAARFRARGCSNPSWEATVNSWPVKSKWESLSFMGCLYFLPPTSTRKELVSFDLREMVFTFANLPPYECDDERFLKESLVLVDGGCSLAVFQASLTINGSFSLWTVETSNSDATSLCWSKRYSFTGIIHKLLYLKRSGDLVYTKGWSQLISHNIQTRATKLLPEEVLYNIHTTHVCSYKESLVLINDKDVDAPTFAKMIERAEELSHAEELRHNACRLRYLAPLK